MCSYKFCKTSMVIKFYFRLHQCISLYHFLYHLIYLAYLNLACKVKLVSILFLKLSMEFRYKILCIWLLATLNFIRTCAMKKRPGHLIILWCVKNSLESSENRIFLEKVGSKAWSFNMCPRLSYDYGRYFPIY